MELHSTNLSLDYKFIVFLNNDIIFPRIYPLYIVDVPGCNIFNTNDYYLNYLLINKYQPHQNVFI